MTVAPIPFTPSQVSVNRVRIVDLGVEFALNSAEGLRTIEAA